MHRDLWEENLCSNPEKANEKFILSIREIPQKVLVVSNCSPQEALSARLPVTGDFGLGWFLLLTTLYSRRTISKAARPECGLLGDFKMG